MLGNELESSDFGQVVHDPDEIPETSRIAKLEEEIETWIAENNNLKLEAIRNEEIFGKLENEIAKLKSERENNDLHIYQQLEKKIKENQELKLKIEELKSRTPASSINFSSNHRDIKLPTIGSYHSDN